MTKRSWSHEAIHSSILRSHSSSRSSAVPFNCHGSGSLPVRMPHDILLNGPVVRVVLGHDFQIVQWNISTEPTLSGFHQDHIMPSVEARDAENKHSHIKAERFSPRYVCEVGIVVIVDPLRLKGKREFSFEPFLPVPPIPAISDPAPYGPQCPRRRRTKGQPRWAMTVLRTPGLRDRPHAVTWSRMASQYPSVVCGQPYLAR